MKFTHLAFALAGAALVSACATDIDVKEVASLKPQGAAFAQALHKNYVERATFEEGEMDWDSVEFFNIRARAAAAGTPMAPQPVAERELMTAMAEIKSANAMLTAALATKAPVDAPAACAQAQAGLEHWMEQAEEGHQVDHIAMAKKMFDDAMPSCKAKPVVVVMKIPGPFEVLFDFDKATLDETAMNTIAAAAKAAGMVKPSKVMVVGHADTTGSMRYNEALATKRAHMVMVALNKAGIDASMLSLDALGETKPAVSTGDEVKERRNRRVEISLVK